MPSTDFLDNTSDLIERLSRIIELNAEMSDDPADGTDGKKERENGHVPVTATKSLDTPLQQTGDADGRRLWKMRAASELVDFHFRVGSAEIRAHRLVLALRSEFFAAFFRSQPNAHEFEVVDFGAETVEKLLEFVYCGHVEYHRARVLELYKAAVHFAIPALKKKCVNWMNAGITKDVAPDLLILAVQQEEERLITSVLEYAKRNGGRGQLALHETIHGLLQTDLSLYTKVMNVLRG
ncbi:BTB domain-containing protein [Aphelenchoides fujianensis]|nr:BTB domain-containing protein [Aphelenchoides fujianensis]